VVNLLCGDKELPVRGNIHNFLADGSILTCDFHTEELWVDAEFTSTDEPVCVSFSIKAQKAMELKQFKQICGKSVINVLRSQGELEAQNYRFRLCSTDSEKDLIDETQTLGSVFDFINRNLVGTFGKTTQLRESGPVEGLDFQLRSIQYTKLQSFGKPSGGCFIF